MDRPGQMTAAGETTGPGAEHAWVRMMPWWHVSFVVTLAVTAGFAVAADHHHPLRLGLLLGVYAALAALYGWLMVPGRCMAGAWSTVYLAGAAGLFVAGVFLFSGTGFLLFVLIPHCFMLLEQRPAIAATIGLMTVNVGADIADSGGDPGTAVSATVFGALGVALALLLGSFISRIIEQSAQRADLIAELERTRSELSEVGRQAGALAEREHLAGEIHDVLAQGFTSLVMLLQAAQAAMDRGDLAAARRSVDLAEPAARDGLAEARSLIAALAPPHLQDAPLPDALRRVGEDLGARFGFAPSFEAEGTPRPLSTNTDIVLLRAAQEALANVGRHAAARSARVRLVYGQRDVTLVVADDGSGLHPGCPDGFGLGQLRSRAEAAGGRVEVTSVPGGGTTVTVVLPDPGVPDPGVPDPAVPASVDPLPAGTARAAP